MATPGQSALTPIHGDVILRPLTSAWILLILGSILLVIAWSNFSDIFPDPTRHRNVLPDDLPVLDLRGLAYTLLFGSLGGMMAGRALWLMYTRPRWIIGSEQLQFVNRTNRVLLAIPYSNLKVLDYCNPRGFDACIGFQLFYPTLVKRYPEFLERWAHGSLRRYGYDWSMTASESALPLHMVVERIRERWRRWQEIAPSNGGQSTGITTQPSLAVPGITTAQDDAPQQNFIQKNP